MGKSLSNFQRERDKFSPKKKRRPIHSYGEKEMRCPLHDDGEHRSCIGPGCKVFDEQGSSGAGSGSSGAGGMLSRSSHVHDPTPALAQ